MKTFTEILVLICLLIASTELKAHQPDLSTTMLVEQTPGKWIVQIRAALTAFEYEVKSNYGDDAYSTPEEFQELCILHVTNQLIININGQRVDFHNGQVKLGHETSILFELSNVPDNIETIGLTNTSFSNIPRNKGALMVYKKDIPTEQFILTSNNEHTAQLRFDNSNFIMINNQALDSGISFKSPLFIVMGVCFLFGIAIFFLLKKDRSHNIDIKI